ncbi:ligand-binding sensor domain-containing protein, partial [Dyadobacter sp.]|uniref:ligand-binding sensor domain-containing protein n=1 Tax=Dyadobacter sp. TaxID=1914288 RepID=UPI003F71BE3B
MFKFCAYILISATICLFSMTQANANDPQLNFTALTSANGLSSNTVHAILKDRHGLLWFGTDDGLNKYDGTEFTLYRNESTNPASIASNDITSLHEDRAGRIWVGTIQGALNLYDRKKDAFKRVCVNESVSAITSDPTGKLWVGTIEGLVWVDPVTFKLTRMSQRTNAPVEIRDQLILSFYEDKAGQMWIGTLNGLFIYNPKTDRFRKIDYVPGSHSQVKAIQGDQAGNIWVGTFHGLYKLTAAGTLLQTFKYQADNAQTISSNMIYSIVAEGPQTLLICTDGGLNVMNIETGKVTRYAPDARNPFSLTNKSVRSVLIDDRGIFWLGTYKGGVNKYDKNLTIFGLKKSDTYDPDGLSAPFVTSFAEKTNGDLFVGTDGGGLNLYHRKTNLFTKVPLSPKNKLGTSGLAVLSLKMTGDHLWIGTFQDGLFQLDAATGKYLQFTQTASKSSLGNNDIFCITTDRRGKIWIGTNGGGVNELDPKTGQFVRHFDENTIVTKRVIPLNGYIRDILEDKNGKLWIGSHGTGLVIYDPEKRKSIHFDKKNSALPGNNVLSIFEDSRGDIWVGTGGEGLAKYNPANSSFSVFGQKQGLISGVINKILEDAQGRIWVSTNNGLSYLDMSTKRFVNYTQYNGLQDNTFVLGAGIRTRDNLLYFGGIRGFNYLDTRLLRQNKNRIPVVLKVLRVGNKSITPADSSILSEHISVAKSIHLDYKQNFTLTYAALNYTDASQTMYRYRLNGFDDEWHYAGYAKTAGYTNLNPGTYQFEVEAKNQNGAWNTPGTSVQIVVEPPFYMTVYAYIFYAFALFGLVLFMRHRGIRKLEKKFRQEEFETEARRKRELDEMKIEFLTNLSHEFRTPISLILAPLDQLVNRGSDTGNIPHLQGIKRNAKRLLNLVDQLLDFKNLQQHESQLETAPGEIISFVCETAESFQYLSQVKGIDFVVARQIDSLQMDFDANKIERIVLNLLSNAFKHTTRGGTVTLSLFQHERAGWDKWLCIKIE